MQNDIWALGVLAIEALTGRHPFASPGSSGGGASFMAGGGWGQGGHQEDRPPPLGARGHGGNHNVLHTIAHCGELRPPAGVSPECAAFLQAALSPDPALRPSASELLAHPWVTGEGAVAGGVGAGFYGAVSGRKECQISSPRHMTAPSLSVAVPCHGGMQGLKQSPGREAHSPIQQWGGFRGEGTVLATVMAHPPSHGTYKARAQNVVDNMHQAQSCQFEMAESWEN